MNSSKSDKWRTGRRAVFAAVLCSALLLPAGSFCSAQTIKPVPGSVDVDDLRPVVLHVVKADGSIDSALIDKVKHVKVGDQSAKFHADKEIITITPPKLASGKHSVLLLDEENKEIAKGVILYGDGTSEVSIQELSSRKEEARRDRLAESWYYYILVNIMFGLVLGPFVWVICKGTGGSVLTDKRPLGLPVGSFRSILAYSLVAYMGFFVLTSVLSVSKFDPPEFLLGIMATVIGFYFGSRSGDEGAAGKKTGVVRGTVRHGTNPARGAVVRFKRGADGAEPYSRISDLDGKFELGGVAPGKYKVSATLVGSAPSDEQEISVAEASDHEIEIVIKSAAPAPQSPPQTGAVTVTVKDPDGTPAQRATVVFAQGGVEKIKETTDDAGVYRNDAVPVGDYDVEASLAPHNPSDKTRLTVAAGGKSPVELKLKE